MSMGEPWLSLSAILLAALFAGGCDDGDGGSDGDADTDADTDADSDFEPDPELCPDEPTCTRPSDCGEGELCISGSCGPSTWAGGEDCPIYSSDCIWTSFPDPCYAAGVPDECPTRPEPIRHPACSRYLELGGPGTDDDAQVMRLLHDLWARGRAADPPTRPKVVMAVGDSISMTIAMISVPQFVCCLPDFDFYSGYRLLGQPSTFETVQTALEGQTAAWGVEVLSTEPWYDQMRPEVATVMFGTNEMWSGNEGLEQYVATMRDLVDLLLARNVIPILMTPPPGTYPMSAEREICGEYCAVTRNYETEDYAEVVRGLAAERLLPLVDVHQLFLDFDRPGWEALLADGVHPCLDDCPSPVAPTGTQVRDDALLQMYKFVEARVMTRCPGSTEPPAPAGYVWNDDDVLGNFRGAPPHSYCPDPVASCH
ncbi:MAG: SGNH/GDSL hydrolase family protein [Acidobacteriota bacterium]